MNKAQLVERLSKRTRVPKAQSEMILNAALEIIQRSVSKGEEVKLVGFGTFDRALRRSRNGRNPKTGTTLVIPEVKVPRFRAGKEFKESVR